MYRTPGSVRTWSYAYVWVIDGACLRNSSSPTRVPWYIPSHRDLAILEVDVVSKSWVRTRHECVSSLKAYIGSDDQYGKNECEDLKFINSTMLQCKVPPGCGSTCLGRVDGSKSDPNFAFSYNAPLVMSVTPSTGHLKVRRLPCAVDISVPVRMDRRFSFKNLAERRRERVLRTGNDVVRTR